MLRLSLGVVFLWFGFLKFFPGISPAEDIAGRTISTLTFGLLKPSLSMPLLAVWECIIGLGLITKAWMRLTLILLYFQMAGTFLPVLFFPHETFSGLFVPTLLGQYIIKNLVLISGGIVLGAAAHDNPAAAIVTRNEPLKLVSTRAIAETFEDDFAAHKN